MKKINALLLLLMTATYSFNQVTASTARAYEQKDYLKKAKRRK